MPRIAYLVHDLNDPAVARRVRMLRAAGEDVVVIGFYRLETPPADIDGAPVVALARTADAKLVRRALAVLHTLLHMGPLIAAARGADVLVGRNLEGLALASRARRALPGARLVYECLDIHRLLLGASAAARAIQQIEAALLREVDLLIVSSPAFLQHYFSRRMHLKAPALVVENKLLVLDEASRPELGAIPPGPPWSIGWLGNLRCRRSLTVLKDLARRLDGRIEVLVAGRPSPAVFDDLPGEIAAAPNCTYLGAYTPDQQAEIYSRCHFAWAVDWFEEGLNSSWLLPNRVYEAQAFGAVPIALASVETGRWLQRRQAGVLLDDALEGFEASVANIDMPAYMRLREAISAIPPADLIADRTDCRALAIALRGQMA